MWVELDRSRGTLQVAVKVREAQGSGLKTVAVLGAGDTFGELSLLVRARKVKEYDKLQRVHSI
jgi:hypothetical protein